jgi:hypothetical protein
MYRSTWPEVSPGRDAERRALALGVAQELGVSSVLGGLPSVERERLDSTIARLRRNRGARVMILADRSREALSAAEVIGRYLIVRGVPRAQVRIVAEGAIDGRVKVVLDTLRRAR